MKFWRKKDVIIPPEDGYPEIRVPQYQWWYCLLMNIIDCRYWFCECGYWYPHGQCFLANCRWHGLWRTR